MKILVINPNTTATMTDKIGREARRHAASGSEIIATNPSMGPVSIEGHYDEAMSVIGVLDVLRRAEAEGGYAGAVIACFGDPGLLAAREVFSGPVLGIAEAAMHAASFLATGFSIVTTLGRTCIIAEHLTERYGMRHFCRRIRAIELPVLALEDESLDIPGMMRAECERALAEDGSAAIVLGCAGMADLAHDLSESLGVPVIDGVTVAVKFIEALAGLGLGTAKRGDLAFPIAKPYTGLLADFGPK